MFKAISFAAVILAGVVSPMNSHAQSVIDDFRKQLEGYRSDIKGLRDEVTELRKKLAESEGPADKTDMTSIPEGAVVAFVRECPKEGWSPYFPAVGRMIVGAGPHEKDRPNLDQNGNELTVYRSAGTINEELLHDPNRVNGAGWNSTGGAETHTLKVEEMPRHTHEPGSLAIQNNEHHIHVSQVSTPQHQEDHTGNLWNPVDGRSKNFGGHAHVIAGETEVRGGNKPHNNMPPYIALNFCKKEAG